MRWRDTETPWLPLMDPDPTGRGQGSNHRAKEREVGAYGGLKVTQTDVNICRRHWDRRTPWPAFRDAWFAQRAVEWARSIRFLHKLRRRVLRSLAREQAPAR